MIGDPVHSWLLRLCDPQGAVGLPPGRLDSAGMGRLLRLADRHAVTGAVLDNIGRIDAAEGRGSMVRAATGSSGGVEAAIAGARARWFALNVQSLVLRQRVRQIARALAADGVPVGILKGEDFADRLYVPAGLRPFRDIDLMVPREMMPQAAAVMAALGFQEAACGRHAGDYGERTWDDAGPPLVRVDIHWNLINSPAQRSRSSLPWAAFDWSGAPGKDACPLQRVSPEGMLLVAAVHAVLGHRFDRLQQLCDIRQICRGIAGPIDVAGLREVSRRCGVLTAVGGALEVTARLLDDEAVFTILHRFGRHEGAAVPWRLVVGRRTLFDDARPLTKLQRTVVREWLKRAA